MAVYPIRGQVLVVKGIPKEAVTRLGGDKTTGENIVWYMIPRPLSGVTILEVARRQIIGILRRTWR